MTTERFIIFLLGCALAYMYFYGTPETLEPQRASQPITIDTEQPTTIIYNTPQPWPTVPVVTATPFPIPIVTATSQPTAVPGTALVNGGTTLEPQRGEQGNERGCASYRNCED